MNYTSKIINKNKLAYLINEYNDTVLINVREQQINK